MLVFGSVWRGNNATATVTLLASSLPINIVLSSLSIPPASSLLLSLLPAHCTMFATFVTVALFSGLAIKGARADFAVNTPTLVQVNIGWSEYG